mmetsp:Transcript_78939/g.92270  ORF Transcript_78939/g.92270 Transcript_78939/m.92270 type:complete len:106 (-) Transcript_78939:8-325(-)
MPRPLPKQTVRRFRHGKKPTERIRVAGEEGRYAVCLDETTIEGRKCLVVEPQSNQHLMMIVIGITQPHTTHRIGKEREEKKQKEQINRREGYCLLSFPFPVTLFF